MSEKKTGPRRFPLTVFAVPLNDTECGACPLGVGRVCAGFGKGMEYKPRAKYTDPHKTLRLPECVAAEKA